MCEPQATPASPTSSLFHQARDYEAVIDEAAAASPEAQAAARVGGSEGMASSSATASPEERTLATGTPLKSPRPEPDGAATELLSPYTASEQTSVRTSDLGGRALSTDEEHTPAGVTDSARAGGDTWQPRRRRKRVELNLDDIAQSSSSQDSNSLDDDDLPSAL